jgi:hypothetical protein
MKKHYIILSRYMFMDDDTGTEVMQMRRKIREDIGRAMEILEPHKVNIKKVHEQNFWDHKFMGQTHGVALEFETTEDYVMAKLLIHDLVDELRQQNSPWSGQ